MLVTVLVMALAVSIEPFRIGMTVLMLNRPRPVLQLCAFLCGGFAMGITVGLVVLFVLHHALRIDFLADLFDEYFTLAAMQLLIGLMLLVIAAVVACSGRFATRLAPLTNPAQRVLNGPSLAVAGVAGIGIALPSIDYLAALAVILASGVDPLTQVAVVVVFNVVAFAFVELPLLGYLLAPKATVRWVEALHGWIRARRRRDVVLLLAALGCGFLVVGALGL